MAITFGILAALISAIAIYAGYINGLAKDEQAELLKKDKSIHEKRTDELAGLEKLIKDQNNKYNAIIANLAEKFDLRDQKEGEIDKLEQELASLENEVKELESRLADFKAKVPDIGDVDRLIKDLQDAQKAIAQIEALIEETKVENNKLTVEITQQEDTIAYNKKWIKNHTEYQAQDELTTTVQAVYKNWGFVVLANGDGEGVTPRSMLLVKRGDELIGELQVKTSTNTLATAEIIFETIKEDDFIQIGDKVFPKPKEKPPVPEAENSQPEKKDPVKPKVEENPFADPF